MGSFKNFPASDLDIVAPDGTLRASTRGIVTGKTIIIEDVSVVIEPGDEIRRKLPNGREEVFTVHDPRFQQAWSSLPAHYQVKFSRKGAFQAGTGGHYSITVSGHNSRVNIGSVDHSTNTVQDRSVFTELRGAISKLPTEEDRTAAADLVQRMESAKDKGSFLRAYSDFAQLIAAHATILSPFLPALTKLL